MKIELSEPSEIRIYGLDKRGRDKLVWCALTYGIPRLFWVDGLLICLEVYERAIKYEVEKGFFPISHICYAEMTRYNSTMEAKKGAEIPVVDASEMKVFKNIAKFIREKRGISK